MSTITPVRDLGLFAPSTDKLNAVDFQRLSKLVYESCGIRLDVSKQVMVESRLRKRLRETDSGTFGDYWKILSQGPGREQELVALIDVMTTNKTDFFREPAHFDFLSKRVLPEFGPMLKQQGRTLQIWSAGCSTGKEPYTLAMVLSECRKQGTINNFSILGTDICTDVLAEASRAIYPEHENLEAIPMALRKQYLLKSRNRNPPTFRMTQDIRATVRFNRLNFMDPAYGMENQFDTIFCRNVMIYFDRPTQEAVVNKFCACLRPNGFLFTGHSETLNGLKTPLVGVAPTIYRKARA